MIEVCIGQQDSLNRCASRLVRRWVEWVKGFDLKSHVRGRIQEKPAFTICADRDAGLGAGPHSVGAGDAVGWRRRALRRTGRTNNPTAESPRRQPCRVKQCASLSKGITLCWG